MEKVEQAIRDYEAYRSRFAQGFLNVTAESEITGSIRLSDSEIDIPFNTKEDIQAFFENDRLKMASFDKYIEKYGDKNLEELQAENPDLAEEFAKSLFDSKAIWKTCEVMCHEVIHAIQKHSYRSVFSLSTELQAMEHREMWLFFHYVQYGGKWKTTDSFLAMLKNIKFEKEHEREELASCISDNSQTILEVVSEKSSGLNLLHLIEGQAFIASREALSAFLSTDLPENTDLYSANSEIYTAAWSAYKKAGGTNAAVFVITVGAALRYGDILYVSPHPVDIFNYLLNFVREIEEIYNKSGYRSAFGNLVAFQSLVEKLKTNKPTPIVSTQPSSSYVKKPISMMSMWESKINIALSILSDIIII